MKTCHAILIREREQVGSFLNRVTCKTKSGFKLKLMGLVGNLSLYQIVITTFLMSIRIKLKIRKIHDGGISFELFLCSVNLKTSQKV